MVGVDGAVTGTVLGFVPTRWGLDDTAAGVVGADPGLIDTQSRDTVAACLLQPHVTRVDPAQIDDLHTTVVGQVPGLDLCPTGPVVRGVDAVPVDPRRVRRGIGCRVLALVDADVLDRLARAEVEAQRYRAGVVVVPI